MKLYFGEQDVIRANKQWGCNCGPAALAAALGLTLEQVRPFMGPFELRGYTNVINMRQSIAEAGGSIVRTYEGWPPIGVGIVRIQWGGPWIINGKPARWAARQSHWVATWRNPQSWLYVFDVNAGLQPIDVWEDSVVPAIVQSIKRADGKWTISHSWGITT